MIEAARETLQRVFGHAEFRGLQESVIGEVLAGRDVIAVLPTGGGKSFCYQIPAMLRPGVGLVVSPLIALMADQVAALRAAAVAAARLDSTIPLDVRRETLAAAREGKLDLLYISPEGLFAPSFLEALQTIPLALVAIDEAHCVSQWGHDFRPEYRALGKLAELFPTTPRIAVTATADLRTQADIRAQLRLEDARAFIASFDRPNLVLSAQRKSTHPTDRVVDLVRTRTGVPGIVYASTREGVETIAAALAAANIAALAYHAGLDAALRDERQRRFQREDDVVMVAEGIAFYGAGDLRRSLMWAANSNASDAIKAVQVKKARQLFGFFDGLSCRRAAVRRYFGEEDPSACGVCDICANPPASIDTTQLAAKALSAVLRLDQRFGRGRVVDHLLGKPARDAIDADYATRSTYGCGADQSEATWRRVIEHLLFEGLLSESDTDRPILRVSDEAGMRAVFKGEREIRIREEAKPARRSKEDRRAARDGRRSAAAGFAGEDARLFETLRSWRREAAAAANVPPYVIFHDATLAAIVARKPTTLAELAAISGVGEAKLARHGAGPRRDSKHKLNATKVPSLFLTPGATAPKRAARREHMIGYVCIGTNDCPRSVRFYDATLAPLNYAKTFEEGGWAGYGPGGKKEGLEIYIATPANGEPATLGNGSMLSFKAPSRAAVDAFHAAALQAGGKDEGAPGVRGEYDPPFYGAYVRDPEGNKMCAYFKG